MLGADVTPKVGEGIGLDLWGNSPIRHALLAAPGTSARNAAGGGRWVVVGALPESGRSGLALLAQSVLDNSVKKKLKCVFASGCTCSPSSVPPPDCC